MSFRLDTYNPYWKPDNKINDPFGPLLTCKSMMAKCWHLFVNINRYQNSSDSFNPNPLWILHVHLYTVADYQSSDWMATIILWLTSPLHSLTKLQCIYIWLDPFKKDFNEISICSCLVFHKHKIMNVIQYTL